MASNYFQNLILIKIIFITNVIIHSINKQVAEKPDNYENTKDNL